VKLAVLPADLDPMAEVPEFHLLWVQPAAQD
jgi:hypothetical protein